MTISAERVIELLELEPHWEGGHFRQTYRARLELPAAALAATHAGPRAASTAIYYLFTPAGPSRLHRVATDEVFHHYLGDPVDMLLLEPGGQAVKLRLGPDLAAGDRPQRVVPAGVWQGSRLAPGGRFALVGATVAPGFERADYQEGDRAALTLAFPAQAELIAALTP